MSDFIDISFARPEQYLKDHLKNVGELSFSFGSRHKIGNVAKLCGLCHDIGKYSREWQEYLRKSINNEDCVMVEHSENGAVYLKNVLNDFISKQEDRFTIVHRYIPMLCNIVKSHHGQLHDDFVCSDDGGHLLVNKIGFKQWDNDSVGIDTEITEEIEKVIPLACEELVEFDENNKPDGKVVCFRQMFLGKMLYSILIDSDRTDAGRISGGISTNKLPNLREKFDIYTSGFKPNSSINMVRNKILSQCIDAGLRLESGKIYGLSTDTGSGKTCSSLAFALNHSIRNNMKRVIYVSPFLTILDQVSSVYRSIFGGMYDRCVVEDYSSSSRFKDVFVDNWDKPIILTTMVNFMETLMDASGSELRKLHNMGDSVIIFDEIQQIPMGCIANFNECINILSSTYGTTSLMCTATTPILHDVEFVNSLNMVNSNIVSLSDSERSVFTNRCQYVDLSNKEMSISGVADFIIENMNTVNSFLCVVNTKKESRDLYMELVSRNIDYCVLLNTNLTKNDRMRIIEDITLRTSNNKKIICVSTNLIEAGVDLSFDMGCRFCGGEDNIIQTAGRINRNATCVNGKLFIIRLKDESSAVGSDYIIRGDIYDSKEAFIKNRKVSTNSVCSTESLNDYNHIRFFGIGINTNRKKDTQERIKYPINDNTNAFDLLSNKDRNVYVLKNKKREGLSQSDIWYTFQYKTVSDNFRIIEENTTVFICNTEELRGVWNRFCELCVKLDTVDDSFNNSNSNRELYHEMVDIKKIMQSNSVSVRNNDRILDELYENNGIYVDFDNEHYSEKTGLVSI